MAATEPTEPMEIGGMPDLDVPNISINEVPADDIINDLGVQLAQAQINLAKANALLKVRDREIQMLRALKSQREGPR